MKCRPKYLFFNLISILQPSIILDIGSMNGDDSKRFRKMSSRSQIEAIEANPNNFEKMKADQNLIKNRIRLNNLLISNKETSDFYITDETKTGIGNQGSSSIRKPISNVNTTKITIDAISLENFLISKNIAPHDTVALWIDVEGSGYEVLESINKKSSHIEFLQIEAELETRWEGQRLKSDILTLCTMLNLKLICESKHDTQQDLVFINKDVYEKRYNWIRLAILVTKLLGPTSSRIFQFLRF